MFAERPFTVACTGTSASPAGIDWSGVVTPYAVVVPSWKRAVVAVPAGFTEPVSVTDAGTDALGRAAW